MFNSMTIEIYTKQTIVNLRNGKYMEPQKLLPKTYLSGGDQVRLVAVFPLHEEHQLATRICSADDSFRLWDQSEDDSHHLGLCLGPIITDFNSYKSTMTRRGTVDVSSTDPYLQIAFESPWLSIVIIGLKP